MWQVDSQTITQGGAVAFLLIASGSLLLLYFFLDKAFFVILVSWHITLHGMNQCSILIIDISRHCYIGICLCVCVCVCVGMHLAPAASVWVTFSL